MLKTTKKQLRHNKKKRETQKKKKYNKVRHSKKSKTAKGHGKIKKHLNLKKRTLKKQRGGADPVDPTTDVTLKAVRLNEQTFRENQAAQKRRIEEQEHSELLKTLLPPSDLSDDESYEISLTGGPPDEELNVNDVTSMLDAELEGDEVPEETIGAVAQEIMEDFETVNIDEAVERTIPQSPKKKTIKQRLSDVVQKLKGRFTRRRKPYKGPGIPNPLFVKPIATEPVTPIATEVVTPIATEEIELTSPTNIPTERPTIAETSFGALSTSPTGPLSASPTGESFVEVESPTGPLSASPTGESFVEVSKEDATLTTDEEMTDEELLKQLEEEYGYDFETQYDTNENILDETELAKIMSNAAEQLEMSPESSSEQIETELKNPKNRGIFAKVAEKVKNLIGKLSFSKNKPKEAQIKTNIETTLETKFPELKAEMDLLNIDTARLFEAVVANGESTKRIFKNFQLTSKIKDQQKLREIVEMLDAFRHEILSKTITQLSEENQTQMTSLNARIEQLLAQNETLKSGLTELSEKAQQEEPVIVEKVITGIPEEEVKKMMSVLATNNENLLINKADNDELREQISELVELSRDLAVQVQHLKTMKQSDSIDPWVYVEDVPPEYAAAAPTQPQMIVQPVQQPQMTVQPQETTVKQPQMTVQPQETTVQPVAQPQMTVKQPESEQVISISPEQLLDNKTIVIKIMMPRGAQIDTASDTGNTAAEQVASIVAVDKPIVAETQNVDETQNVLSKKDQEVEASATKLREEQETMDAPPAYFPGGNKTINPARVHPASLFNN
jgi:hypothetical protein